MKILFIIYLALFILPVAQAETACYKFEFNSYHAYEAVKVKRSRTGIDSIQVTLKNDPEVIEDRNPQKSEYVLRGRCQMTQSGDYRCAPDLKVPLFINFENNHVEALMFRTDLKTGWVWMTGDTGYRGLTKVECQD